MSAYPYTYPASPFRSAPGSPNVASGSSSYTYTYTSDRDPSSSTSASATGAQPTTRSRTLLFISYRDSIARSAPSRSRRRDYAQHEHEHGDTDTLLFSADDEQQRLIGEEGHGHGHVSVDMDAQLPPRWCVSRCFLYLLPYLFLLCVLLIWPYFVPLSVFRFVFFVLYLALSFRDKRQIMSGNLTLQPVHGFKPKLPASASYAKDELRFESSWDMHSAVPCAALASRDIFILRAFFSSQRLIRLKLRLKTQTPISMHQAIPPDLPTSFSFLALHFSPPTPPTFQNRIHIAFAFTFTFAFPCLRLWFYTSTLR